jgi:hypothetical protein
VRADPSSPVRFAVVPHPPSFPHMASPWLFIGPEALYWGPRHAAGIWKEGVAFPSWNDDSIPAHVGRMLAYALRDDQANDLQRAMITRAMTFRPLPASYRGVAPTLRGLAGHWAVPGTEYPNKLAQIASMIQGM